MYREVEIVFDVETERLIAIRFCRLDNPSLTTKYVYDEEAVYSRSEDHPFNDKYIWDDVYKETYIVEHIVKHRS